MVDHRVLLCVRLLLLKANKKCFVSVDSLPWSWGKPINHWDETHKRLYFLRGRATKNHLAKKNIKEKKLFTLLNHKKKNRYLFLKEENDAECSETLNKIGMYYIGKNFKLFWIFSIKIIRLRTFWIYWYAFKSYSVPLRKMYS